MSRRVLVLDRVCSDCRVTCVGCPGKGAPESERLAYIEARQAQYRAQDALVEEAHS